LEDLRSKLKVENKALVQSVINEMNASTNTQIWEEFEVRFNNVHKNFYDKFYSKHPDLTQNEKRLVAFLKLNMSTKEISMITKQSVHSISVARTRLRRKMSLSNTDINLYSYLDRF
jgi:DNA-binding CsgD family transcriptional regulator